MIINLSRIDDRLIHGQVVTVWAKEANAKRIIVVSDEVSNDEIRKTLVKQAAPPGIKVNVVNVDKAALVYNNPKYKDETVFYLFTNPTEVLRLVEKGVPLKTINLGGMSYKNGKRQLTKAVCIDDEDILAFKKLIEKGVEIDLRVVASDPKVNFEKKLAECLE